MDKCKAKDPSECRFHSKARYNRFAESKEYYEKQMITTKDYEQYSQYKKVVENCQAKMDANKHGLKLLLKEFNAARRTGDVTMQAKLAHRIQKAAQARTKDGVVNKWVEVNSNPTLFGPTVLEEAETKDEVKVPYFLTGTGNLLHLYSYLLNNNHEIVDVDLHRSSREEETEAAKEENNKKAKQLLKEHELAIKNKDFHYVYNNVFEKSTSYMRGLTFKKDERIIKVAGKVPTLTETEEWEY